MFSIFGFGKKRYRRGRSKKGGKRGGGKKPPAGLVRMARKYRIKVSKKVGRRRVYKSLSLIRRQIKKKMRKMRKSRKVRKSRRVRRVRRSRFGFGNTLGSEYVANDPSYGYDKKVVQKEGIASQSSQMKNGVGGVYSDFFGQDVPKVIPPYDLGFMAQSDGTMFGVGSPFYGYPAKFGKRRRRYNVTGSGCNRKSKRICQSTPNCTYTKRGCRRRSGTATKGVVYEGPSLEFGKRRRRYSVTGSACNRKTKRICQSTPNCTYTKRGCRRRSGTTTKGVVYEGPSLEYGRRHRRVTRRRRRVN